MTILLQPSLQKSGQAQRFPLGKAGSVALLAASILGTGRSFPFLPTRPHVPSVTPGCSNWAAGCKPHRVPGTSQNPLEHQWHRKIHLLTCPNTKQYSVIPMAQTSKACRAKKAQLNLQQTVRARDVKPKPLQFVKDLSGEDFPGFRERLRGHEGGGAHRVG